MFIMNRYLYVFLFSFIITACSTSHAATKPLLQHGISYNNQSDIVNNIHLYFVSEKLDGMRGYWDGKNLYSRQGNKINAPTWFTMHWPNTPLDGELWIERNSFQRLMSCIKSANNSNCWQTIRFYLFDIPLHQGNFEQRITAMELAIKQSPSPYLALIKQYKVNTIQALESRLTQITKQGGEGLMLHKSTAFYKIGRNSDLVKLKTHQDDEAIVLAHNVGKGKYHNKLGSLLVKNNQGVIFKIGSGFTDDERTNPPKIGSTITYRYNGKTDAGIPRFARYWRIRSND